MTMHESQRLRVGARVLWKAPGRRPTAGTVVELSADTVTILWDVGGEPAEYDRTELERVEWRY